MKVIAAYLLAVLGGNTTPSADDLKDILGSGIPFLFPISTLHDKPLFCFIFSQSLSFGAEADDDNIGVLLSELKGKDIAEVIASGREKLASVPSGGGGAAVAVAAASGGGGGAAAPAAAESKKEEKVEEKEESDDDMGFSLFD
ncbi:large ribosomal subunit protein P2z-like isoform X1 [Gastrolobium bilobum]|uniref:large ribosomal subunit protein P2z-like isoform X1 n=1 Tax=Gastrolobium bilobum TaxID=150636 RepID=UPI002AB0A1E7|nr:large ribosomal subunit protein P2z-like isoform X1 [Gastrolobium bilobum]